MRRRAGRAGKSMDTNSLVLYKAMNWPQTFYQFDFNTFSLIQDLCVCCCFSADFVPNEIIAMLVRAIIFVLERGAVSMEGESVGEPMELQEDGENYEVL